MTLCDLNQREYILLKHGRNGSNPFVLASGILGARWTCMLLDELMNGTRRFSDLRRGLPCISTAILSKCLKDLEGASIVTRWRSTDGRNFFEYALTDSGLAVEPIIVAMKDWGRRWITTGS